MSDGHVGAGMSPERDVMKYITVTLNPAIDQSYILSEPFRAGELNRASEMSTVSYSGKGINVSRELLRLGVDSKVLCLIGEENAEEMTSDLRRHHMNLFSVKVPGRVRRNISVVDPDGGVVEINEPGEEIELEDVVRFLSLFDKLINERENKTVIISGSAPPGFRSDIYKRLVIGAKKAGCTVVLDTDGELLTLGAEGKPDLIKPNERELSVLTGRLLGGTGEKLRTSALAASSYLFDETGTAILCTLGENGSVYAGEEGVFACPAKRISIKRFKGAGDCYLARFIYERLERGAGVLSAMEAATEAAASYLEE